ncbi:MAG TPA: LytR C-terminal domain-containing protein [Amycolatopsis sp.]|nr:LytR C-terminal domain-containing protein [Amycolatopsis sp.]
MDVVNATTRTGRATQVEELLTRKGITKGVASTDTRHLTRSTVYHGRNGSAAATAIARAPGGMQVVSDTDVLPGHVRVVLSSDFAVPTTTSAPASAPASTSPSTPDRSGQLRCAVAAE